MPVKFVVLGVIVVVAVGVAVYENDELRQNISQFIDRQRRKLAQHIHDFADNVSGPPQAHAYGPLGNRERRLSESMAMTAQPQSRPRFGDRAMTSGADDVAGEAVELRLRNARRENNSENEDEGERKKAATAAVVAAAAVAGVSVAVVAGDEDEEQQKIEKESGYESALHQNTTSAASASHQHPLQQQEQVRDSVIFSAVDAPSESTKTISAAGTENPFENAANELPSLQQEEELQQQQYWNIPQWAEDTLAFEHGDEEEGEDDEDVFAGGSERGSLGSEFEEVGSVASWTEVGSEVSGDGL